MKHSQVRIKFFKSCLLCKKPRHLLELHDQVRDAQNERCVCVKCESSYPETARMAARGARAS